MEIGEEATVDEVAKSEHDSSCYFCKSQDPPDEATNEFDDAWEEDADLDGPPSGKFKNDAGKLGDALGNQVTATAKVGGEAYAVTTAAHHLIPGNASLKNSKLFKSKKYLWTSGTARGNIGYNVNSKPNGVWSPGNYAVRPWNGAGGRSEEFKQVYAFSAMKSTGTQFHDAHRSYNTFVKNVLTEIHDKLKLGADLWCPEAKKREEKKPEERPPLKVLVSRLHTVSGRMKDMLTGGPVAWRRNIYTSRFALQLMERDHPILRARAERKKAKAQKRTR